MNKNNLASFITVLVVGVILGFFIGTYRNSVSQSVHQMPDGSVMSNNMDMTSTMADMNKALTGKKGDDFDRAFIDEIIIHHQGALDMANLALTNAKHTEIKDLAHAIISAQTEEINQMMTWKTNWYK